MKQLTLLINLLALPIYAEEVTPISEMSIMQMITPLLLVIVLIFLLALIVKKINPKLSATIGKDIDLLSSTQISAQGRLCLVRVGCKDILVGVTNQQITHIQTFNEPVVEKQSEPVTTEIAKLFNRLLRAKQKP